LTLFKHVVYHSAVKLNHYLESNNIRQTQLARAVGLQPQLMYQWVRLRRGVPIERCVAIERATGGVVTRKDLHPNDWHLIWPELVDSETGIPATPRPPVVVEAGEHIPCDF